MAPVVKRQFVAKKLVEEINKPMWPRFTFREIQTDVYRCEIEPPIFVDYQVPGEDNHTANLKDELPEGSVEQILSAMLDILAGREIFFENRRDVDSVGPFKFTDTPAEIAAEAARIEAL